MKEMEEELNEKITYLSGFAAALKDQIHTDIQVLPGNNEPPIPAHRALLVTNQLRTYPTISHTILLFLVEFLMARLLGIMSYDLIYIYIYDHNM